MACTRKFDEYYCLVEYITGSQEISKRFLSVLAKYIWEPREFPRVK